MFEITAKNHNEAIEKILDKVEQVKKIRLIMLEDNSEECLNCGLKYIPLTTYTFKGEVLCPCCDADKIDAYKARIDGYNKDSLK